MLSRIAVRARTLAGKNGAVASSVASPRYLSVATEKIGLDKLGIHGPEVIHHNLSYDDLFEHEVKNGEGEVAKAEYGDTFTVDTGKFTGRSPSDKWIVLNKGRTRKRISGGGL